MRTRCKARSHADGRGGRFMNHPRSAAAAGTTLATLAYLNWPAFCAISMLATAGAALIVWVLSNQARSDRAAALVSAWRAISTSGPEPAQTKPAQSKHRRHQTKRPRCGFDLAKSTQHPRRPECL
jgi:hypothetical protein